MLLQEDITACRSGEFPLYNKQGKIDYCVPENEAVCGQGTGPSQNYPVPSHTARDPSIPVDPIAGCHQLNATTSRCPAGFKTFYSNMIQCYSANTSCGRPYTSGYSLLVKDGDFGNSTLIGCAKIDLSVTRCPELTKAFFDVDGNYHCRLATTACAAPYHRQVRLSTMDDTLIGCAATEILSGLEICPHQVLYAWYDETGAFVDCRGTNQNCPSPGTRKVRRLGPSGVLVSTVGCIAGTGTTCPNPTSYTLPSGHCAGIL